MKYRNLWGAAAIMLSLLGLATWQYVGSQKQVFSLVVESQSLHLKAPNAPTFFLKPESFLGATKSSTNLNFLSVEERQVFVNSSYLKLQPGLWLATLGADRVFVISNDFKAENLDPSLPVNFKSDWTVLQKSSLLPANWPVPNQGWVLLNTGTLSKNIKALSTKHNKPIVRPINGDALELRKEIGQEWQVWVPK